MKNTILLLLAIAGFISGYAQEPCGTTLMDKKYKQQFPGIITAEEQLNNSIHDYINHIDINKFAYRTTDTGAVNQDSIGYDIPVVVHVMHNYGNGINALTGLPSTVTDVVPDDSVYNMIGWMNKVYAAQNDTSGVIAPFRKFVGSSKIRFHLATKDPNGNPTKGITHHASYLSQGKDDQGKLDQWAPDAYYNIWFESFIGEGASNGTVLAYAVFPSTAVYTPYYDGVIAGYNYIHDGTWTIEHETGHYFSLYHPWNFNGLGMGVCASAYCGDDSVDDTPPTRGQFDCPLGDTVCASNYFKVYPSSVPTVDSLVRYPDTTDVENIMNYSSCTNHFTKGQFVRAYGALNSSTGNRSNLWNPSNLANTGALSPVPDLPPVTDFAVKNQTGTYIAGTLTYFTCPGVTLRFINESWQDTITSVEWKFGNGATVTDSVAAPTTYINNKFTVPGWLTFTLSATGNNTGTTTTAYPRSVFIANNTGTPADGYYQEFSTADTASWPMFNYYNNEFKWQHANVGFDDNNSVQYVGYDSRIIVDAATSTYIYPVYGTPKGDFDDLFSIPMDLSSFGATGNCYLNFYSSGAARSSNSFDLNDKLEIDYSTNKGASWILMDTLTKGSLDNMGALSTPYTPSSAGDWVPQAMNIPAVARTPYTLFRFRYYPNTAASNLYSTGNNFYMDRINFSSVPASVSNVALDHTDVVVVPNPTNGDAYVVIKDADNVTARVVVTDITGKAVYTTTRAVNGQTRIQIPHSVISVSGVYLVQTITGSQVSIKKLVVE